MYGTGIFGVLTGFLRLSDNYLNLKNLCAILKLFFLFVGCLGFSQRHIQASHRPRGGKPLKMELIS